MATRPTSDSIFKSLYDLEQQCVDLSRPLGEARPQMLASVSQLREVLATYEAREAQLSALIDAAKDLTEIRDADRVLDAVTQRTQRLLRCDLAYLSARTDQSGEHFAVRAFSGHASPAFIDSAVRVDEGVGGHVVRTGRPVQVADYATSPDFIHTPYLDDRVTHEGIVTLLGVPVEANGRLFGILFAARRTTATFSEDQIALVSSLAAYAAIALDNADLFRAQQSAVEKVERANALLQAQAAAVEKGADVHSRLTEIVLHGGSVRQILEIIADALQGSVTMVDPEGCEVVSHGPAAPHPPFDTELIEALAQSGVTRHAVSAGTRADHDLYVTSPIGGERKFGSIVLAAEQPLSDLDIRTLERATQAVTLHLLSEAAAAEADMRGSGEVVGWLISQQNADHAATERIAQRHRLLGSAFSVLVSEISEGHRDAQLLAGRNFCAAHGGLVAVYNGNLVAVVSEAPEQVRAGMWTALLKATPDTNTTASVCGATTLFELPGKYKEAAACLKLMQALGRSGTCADTAEFGLYSLLLSPNGASALNAVVAPAIGPLLEHDRRHGTSLEATLLTYLDASCNAVRTSSELGVHVNTMTQRLARIDRILGSTWRANPRQLDVHNALRLRSLQADLLPHP
ncbi:GAF domain-containing protein [Rhodococcus sp. 14-2470-1a]|uniref:helix-turn-helix domain-containing protein n=1 Tax=Rhodococcus sp. 14-2470-1a TaxID=2023150 RepID=UPI0015C5E891|nr:GAF domain-containing protein [Rhodococcus sp. 14-2470-1a]